MVSISSAIIDFNNIEARLRLVENENNLDDLVIDFSGNKTPKDVLPYTSPVCIISKYDIKRGWVSCDSCESSSHKICQCLSDIEEEC